MPCSLSFRRVPCANIVAPALLFLIGLLVVVPQVAARKRKSPASKSQATLKASAAAPQKSLRKKLTAPNASITSSIAASPSVAPPAEEIAHQTQSASPAPNIIGASNTSATTFTTSANSFGAVVAPNWLLALIAALVLGVLCVAFAMRSGSGVQTDAAAFAQHTTIKRNTLAATLDDVPSLPESQRVVRGIANTGFPLTTTATSATVAASAARQRDVSYSVAGNASDVTKEIEPIAPSVDVERAEIETRNVLAGEPYDETMIGTRDPGARQIIAAGLLAALAGRNMQKRDNARAVFIKHDYFDQATRDLRMAAAPAERTSAARTLGFVRDTAATPHLIAALEDSSPEVRRAAVEALADVRDPQAVTPLEALRESEKNRKEGNRKIPRALIQRAIEACVIGQEKTEAQTTAAHTTPAPPAVAETTASFATTDEMPTVEAAPVNAEPQIIAATETSHTPDALESSFASATETNSATLEFAPPIVLDHSFVEVANERAQSTVLQSEPSFAVTGGAAPAEIFESNFADEAVTATQFAPSLSPQQEITEAASNPSGALPATLFTQASLIEHHDAASQHWIEVDVSEPEIVGHAAPVKSAAEPFIETNAADIAVADIPAADANAAPKGFPVEPVIETTPPFNAPSFEKSSVPITPKIVGETRPISSAESSAKEIDVAVSDKGIALFNEDLSAVPNTILRRLASEDPIERAAAVEDLAHVSGEDSFRVISAAFDDPSQEVSAAAARALFNSNPNRATSFTRALREAAPERRRRIGAALAFSGIADDAIGHLLGESREKTYDAFSLLFLMSKAGEVQPLMKALEEHPNNEVRLAVVKLLTLSGQQQTLPAFRRLAVRGSLPTEVRSAVMEAIYQINSQTTSAASPKA